MELFTEIEFNENELENYLDFKVLTPLLNEGWRIINTHTNSITPLGMSEKIMSKKYKLTRTFDKYGN